MRGKLLTGAFALATAFGCAGLAAAQDTAPDIDMSRSNPVTSTAIVGFGAEFFSAYNPVTAMDMVSRVPGFSLSAGDTERRGLADSFGNLLIDGRRPSNKTISPETILQRISAEDVERIELIREPVPEYEMRGHARLVNVILREGAGSAASWRLRASHFDGSRIGGIGELAYSFTRGETDINLGLETDVRGPRIRRYESLFDGAGNQIESRYDNEQRRYAETIATASLARHLGDNTRIQIDGRAYTWVWQRHQTSEVTGFAGNMPSLIRFEQSQTTNYGSGGSLTGTLNHDFSDRLSSTSTVLWRRFFYDDGPEPFETYDPGNFVDAIIYVANAHNSETVFRQSFNFTANDQHTIEFGAEAAVNWRDTYLDLQYDDGNTVTPIALPVASTRVEERRAEAFINHVWAISDSLNLESGLRYEFSLIEQTGDAVQSREFSYPKPSITLTWQASEQTSFRLATQRDVAQLDFGKFASSLDVADNNAVVGNPDYEPQRMWSLEAEVERRFGEAGSFTFRIGQDWIEGVDDFVSITTPNGVFDAPGNIGDGTIFRLTWETSLPLDSIGLSNAVLDGFLEWFDTNIFDDLTQQDRHLSNFREWEVRIDYRQSFPDLNLAWGFDYSWLTDGEVYRAREYRREGFTDGDLDIYVETTRWAGLTARLGIDGALDRGHTRERVFYNGSRALGIVDTVEYQRRRQGPLVYLELRGTF
ncbi:TonB-dependent receptor [Hyphobacterium sp. HN65]|uniref:TonB-dependent receptor n=1 Tax=Hyphobacterium lacteum TaxID=3116575 RepID=A0ABU7LPP8_9PROT|nr:TonB-dependent receptor [Hyphobacterium sp. HN65]MEE2525314.1 TonB-dependent receptor [Hyphobacterium sp. HN65]